MSTIFLAFEFSAFFVALPLLVYYQVIPNLPIPYLVVASLGAFVVLRRDPSFELAALVSWSGVLLRLLPLVVRDSLFMVAIGLGVWLFAPRLLFSFMRRATPIWAVVMLLYPLLSVYPQEFLYRAFFFHRYQPLFGRGWGMVFASALAFAFVHIIFRNWLAPLLSLAGGLLFCLTYRSSGSLLLVCVDHAIFGNFLITVGLGQFFYHGVLPGTPFSAHSFPTKPPSPLK